MNVSIFKHREKCPLPVISWMTFAGNARCPLKLVLGKSPIAKLSMHHDSTDSPDSYRWCVQALGVWIISADQLLMHSSPPGSLLMFTVYK